MNDLDKTLQTYFLDKAPKMPADVQNILIKYGPYLVLIGVVLSAIGVFTALGLISYGVPGYGMMGAMYGRGMYQLYLVLGIITTALNGLAVPGLLKRKLQGWKYLWYSLLVGTVTNIISLNVLGLIIGAGLGFYILYQIKHHYK